MNIRLCQMLSKPDEGVLVVSVLAVLLSFFEGGEAGRAFISCIDSLLVPLYRMPSFVVPLCRQKCST